MNFDLSDETTRAEKQKLIRNLGTFDSNIRYPAPYVGFAGRPSSQIFEHGWHYDRFGYRNDVAISLNSDAGTRRVFIVGDSTMVDGVTTNDTVPGRIQTALREDFGDHVSVNNFGAISSCLNQMIMLTTSKLIDFEPNAIAIIAGGTDIFQPWTFDPRPGYPYNFFAIEALSDEFFSQDELNNRKDSLSQSAIYDLIFDRLKNLRVLTRWKDPAWEWEVVRHFELSLDRLGRLAQGIRIPIYFVLQPMVVRKSTLTDAEKKFASPEFLDYLDRQYSRLKTVVNDYHSRYGVRDFFSVHDLSDIFYDSSQSIFTDIVHYNDIGRQMMAEAVAARIGSFQVSRK